MSKRIDRAIKVYRELHTTVLTRLNQSWELSEQDAENIISEIFQKVAKEEGVTASTVRDQLTRQLELSASECYKIMVEHMLAKDKTKTRFVEALQYHRCDDDGNIVSRLA